MNRTTESRTTTVRESAVHMDHKIIWTYEIPDGQERPNAVNANARKIDGENAQGMMGNININVSETNVSTNYPPTTPGELIRDIKNECLAIINGEVE